MTAQQNKEKMNNINSNSSKDRPYVFRQNKERPQTSEGGFRVHLMHFANEPD